MKKRFPIAAAAALLCASVALAQDNCPHKKSSHVAQSIVFGPSVSCSSVELHWGGLVLNPPGNGCPLFAVITPAHDEEMDSEFRTQCVESSTMPVTLLTIECVRRYIIFIPISSTCVVTGSQNIGTVRNLLTVACPDTESKGEATQPPQSN